MLLLPGGFSYGDALGAGARLALDLRVYFQEELLAFVESGKPVLGICNGFQTLVRAGVLEPCFASWTNETEARSITLTENASGRFECRWVHLAANGNARASFLSQLEDVIFCPVAHGEGNFQVCDTATLEKLETDNLIALRYVDANGRPAGGRYPANPNGSVADIAGICNARGNVLGLMPHPEDHILPIQNPLGKQGGLGLALFQAIVRSAGGIA
jgi:phosphoribosylformylglycinamidine synthase